MGYSATARAMEKLDMIMEASGNGKYANTWYKDDGTKLFYEIGRENDDGSMTGKVWKFIEYEHGSLVKPVGGFRIEPNGDVTRFPHLSKKMRKVAKEPVPMFKLI